MKLVFQIAVLVFVIVGSSNLSAKKPPNIVLIISDDQGWRDYGFAGHPDIKTPHLDKLAGQSLHFPRGYVAAPICRPSLASLVTGRYPFTHGITGNDADGRNQRAEKDKPFRAAFHQLPSFIKILTENGYLAHQSGKWWEGSWKAGGFTHGMTHGDPAKGGRHGDAGLAIGRKGMEPIETFLDTAKTEEKPFLLWYAPFLPHTPHNPPPRLLKKYQTEGRADDVAKYYACCEWFDETCGQLLGSLKKRGLEEDTVILYLCDNGWAATSTNKDDPNQAAWGGYAQRSKSSPYEMGIRTPMMISWPGKVEPKKSADLAHAIDFFPTIMKLTGLETPKNLPGIDLLDEKTRSDREAVFGVTHSTHNMELGNPDSTLQYLWCVEKDWKLLVRFNGKDTTRYIATHEWDTLKVRLYNLKDDPGELNEIAAKHPEVVARLRKRIDDWHPVKPE